MLTTSAANMQSVISQTRARLSAAEGEISALQEECAQLRADLVYYEYQLSYIARIPLEVLGQIFLACLPHSDERIEQYDEELEGSRSFVSQMSEAPFSLGLVCKMWRTVSLGMRKLWCSPSGNFALSRAWSINEMRAIHLSVERSHPAPLTLIVNFEANGKFIPSGLRELLRSPSARWLSVEFKNLSYLLMDLLMDELYAPLLVSFRVDNLTSRWPWRGYESLAQAENLREVHLAWVAFNFDQIQLPWDQLTYLGLEDVTEEKEDALTWEHALAVLARSPRLTKLTIGVEWAISKITHELETLVRACASSYKHDKEPK